MSTHARYFPNGLADGWETISASDYREDIHKGKLHCPDPTCHGPVTFARGSEWYAGKPRKQKAVDHFRIASGCSHAEGCDCASNASNSNQLTFSEAAEKGGLLLVNYNNFTQLSKHASRPVMQFMRAVLKSQRGELLKKWQDENEGNYAVKSVDSLNGLKGIVKKWKEFGGQGALSDRLSISHNGAVTAWPELFMVKGREDEAQKNEILNYTFTGLVRASERAPTFLGNMNVFPARMPVFRHGLAVVAPEAGQASPHQDILLTNSIREFRMESQVMSVQDVLIVKDKNLRDKISAAPEFGMISSPHIAKWNLDWYRAGKDPHAYMFSPIIDESQISIG